MATESPVISAICSIVKNSGSIGVVVFSFILLTFWEGRIVVNRAVQLFGRRRINVSPHGLPGRLNSQKLHEADQSGMEGLVFQRILRLTTVLNGARVNRQPADLAAWGDLDPVKGSRLSISCARAC